MKEGVIRFRYECVSPDLPPCEEIPQLIEIRDLLKQLDLIGISDGIGYGNLGLRLSEECFLVTASGTGDLKNLGAEHLCSIESVDRENFTLTYRGEHPPSSESITYHSVFSSGNNIRCMIHVHSHPLFDYFRDMGGLCIPSIDYGSPELASVLAQMMDSGDLNPEKDTFCLQQHSGGIYFYATDLESCQSLVFDLLEEATEQSGDADATEFE